MVTNVSTSSVEISPTLSPSKTISPNLTASDRSPPTQRTKSTQKPTETVTPNWQTATNHPYNTTSPTPIFLICSPLVENPLPELSKIVSSPFRPPPAGKDDRHHGVDFAYYKFGGRSTIQGARVQTVLPGVVAAAIGESFPYGNAVIVETPGGMIPEELRETLVIKSGESIYTLYAHLKKPPNINSGETVPACFVIGNVGKSGNADVIHLHLETRVGPANWIVKSLSHRSHDTSNVEERNYRLWRTSGKFKHFDPMDLLTMNKNNR